MDDKGIEDIAVKTVWWHGEYVGTVDHLIGKTAMVCPHEREGYVRAQFDDTRLTEAFGLHVFREKDFITT